MYLVYFIMFRIEFKFLYFIFLKDGLFFLGLFFLLGLMVKVNNIFKSVVRIMVDK